MIDERLLADPARCPSCAAVLPGPVAACPSCRVALSGPTAGRLWQVSVQAAQLLAERAALVAALRAEAAGQTLGQTGPAHAEQPAPTYAPPGAPSYAPLPAPRPEWTPRRVQNLLLALGVGLLAVAAVIFVVVAWGDLGVGARAALMTGVTALAAAGAHRAARRRLSATAEALSLLTVGLALLDCAGAWASDLAGLRGLPGAVVAAGSVALVALGAGAGSLALRTRALRLSAALLGQLTVPLLAMHVADDTDHPAALVGAAFAAQGVALAAIAATWWGGRDTRDARVAVGAGAIGAGVLATGLALLAAYLEDGSLVVGTALLLVVAGAVATAAETAHRRGIGRAEGGFWLAPALVVAAVWAPVVDAATERWTPTLLATVALGLLGATLLVPADRRRGPAAVTMVAAWSPALAAVPDVTFAVTGRLQWLDRAWTAQPGSARDLLPLTDSDLLGWTPDRAAPAALLLLVVALAAVAPALVRPALRPATALAPVALALAGLLAILALDGSHAAGVATDLGLALALLLAGTWLVGRDEQPAAVSAAGSGLLVLTLGLAWSFAVDTASLAALPAAAAVLAVAVASAHRRPALRAASVIAAAVAVLLLVIEAGAVARYRGAGWPAVDAVTLTVLLVAADVALAAVVGRTSAAVPLWAVTRRVVAAVAIAAAVADAAALASWQGATIAEAGLAACVVAAVLLAAATLELPARVVPQRLDPLLVTTVVAAVGLAAAATDADQLWLALLALGVAAAVVGLRVDHRVGWLSGLLLASSSWVRLALSDVTAPEAYTVPPALALLVVGWRRRVTDPQVRSWPAYAPGLLLATGPSLLRAVTDAGTIRPFLLGVAALAVLAAGVVRRLQAPLVIGGAVLAVDAVVQLAPYLAVVYDAVPRWVTIGAVGLLLLAAGATYEQRVRDLRRVGERLGGLG